MQATMKELQRHSTDILCVVWGEEYAVSAERMLEGFLEEAAA